MLKLTKEEVRILVTGKGSKEQRLRAEEKLQAFQALRVDPGHVGMVDKLIPIAEKYAYRQVAAVGTDPAVKGPAFDRAFHLKMNELTRAAGLRV